MLTKIVTYYLSTIFNENYESGIFQKIAAFKDYVSLANRSIACNFSI